MALQTQLLYSFTGKVKHCCSPTFTIRSEKTTEVSESSDSAPKKTGVGFGSSNESNSKRKQKEKEKEKGQRRRASIIRRSPIEKPAFVSEQQPAVEESKNESAFLLAWLGFGAIILVEGISLAASGFLPEEWDKIFVKYLYPSFTPTVFVFVAGAVAYGVFKFLQNEKTTQQK